MQIPSPLAPSRVWLRLIALLTAFILSLICLPVFAQDNGAAFLTRVDTTSFPKVTGYLSVRDAEGAFLNGLDPQQVTVVEGENRIPVDELSQVQTGTTFVIAVSPGRSLGIRDGQGISRWDMIRSTIKDWSESSQDETEEDLSLIIHDGPEALHLGNRRDLWLALQNYTDNPRDAEPSMDVLMRAIETAAGDQSQPGMGRAVLLVTPPPTGDLSIGLQSLAGMAKQQEVRVSVWLVASADSLATPGIEQLKELTATTGGEFFSYSGAETLPDPDTYLATLREVYAFSYSSQLKASGTSLLQVEIASGENTLITAPQEISVTILPPAPVFVAPPVQLLRQNPEDAENWQTELQPVEQDVDILIEFPDGLPRKIVSSTLFVDGSPAVVNNQEPFDQFKWNLSGYIDTGDHLLKAEIVDNLGMVGSTADFLVHIEVKRIKPTLWKTISRNGPWFAGIFVLVAGSMLVLGLLLSGKIRPKVPGREIPAASKKLGKDPTTIRRRNDPLTQEVVVKAEPDLKTRTGILSRISRRNKGSQLGTYAYLTRIDGDLENIPSAPVSVAGVVFLIGTDQARCDLILDDPSIEGVHARLVRKEDTPFIMDTGTVAGTWLNYSPVSQDGAKIEHGDIIHIGRVGFRVTFKEPARLQKPVVIREENIS